MVLVVAIICLAGCSKSSGSKSNEPDIKKYDLEKLVENLAGEGIPEDSIREMDKEKYADIYIHDRELGHANIYVYKDASDAKEYWDNLSERYDNLEYIDDKTAVGDLKDVYDASIEEWIHYEGNVIVFVEQYVANEWAIYVGDDGEEYYGDGTKVSDVKTPSEQRDEAKKLEDTIMNCLK